VADLTKALSDAKTAINNYLALAPAADIEAAKVILNNRGGPAARL